MRYESPETRQGSSWENETESRKDPVVRFIARSFVQDAKDAQHYDSLSELHFSGTNRDVFDKIMAGEQLPMEISTYYANGQIEQIHVIFDGGKTGHNIDVYIKGKALEDLLT